MSLSTSLRTSLVGAAQQARRMDAQSVYFNSFQGRYSDNPRAIAEVLAVARPELRHVWRGSEGHGFRAGTRTVDGGTWAHVGAFGESAHAVVNGWMVSHPKRRGQVWVQTWHGTPLKRIALDAASGLTRESRRAIRRDVQKWDYLVSPNSFSTGCFRQAFGYEGAVLETGYPRNDVLSAPEAEAEGRRVRRELGIEPERTAVLYAPTWRDRVVTADDPGGSSLPLHLESFTRELGDTHTLLLRLHHSIAADHADVEGAATINVSRHPDIRELYLAADILVTDYSSAMFDFAVTGKPILFLAPDLESYRDQMRGFYFDFEAEAPGPIARTTAELADALGGLEEVEVRSRPAYSAFRERFCALEDGGAARRVVEAVFGVTGS